jgi:L-amino acid N-acyltransferase YncA
MIRSASPADAAALARIYAPYVTDGTASFEETPPDDSDMAARMRTGHPWLVVESGGTVAGYAYASAHRSRAAYRWSVDVSVYLAPGVHRRGLGRALYRELLDRLRAQGFVNAYAGIALPNDASVGLHEAMGFTPVGVYQGVGHKHGRWIDVGWWQLQLAAPRPTPPPEPRVSDAVIPT